VISGKDRGREGRVVRVLPREGRVMVDGVALVKKHQRGTGRRARGSSQQLYQQGGIIDAEMFVDISNVQVVCTACGNAARVGHRVEGDRKVRFCRKCETELS
jgi:large subunit ribosomal protein L24